jgi:hypothetical protein
MNDLRLPTLTLLCVVGLIPLGVAVFLFYSRKIAAEDKGMAGSLTAGFLAVIVASVAWSLVQNQISVSQQQANVVLADFLARRVTQMDNIQARLDKFQKDLVVVGLGSLNPAAFGLVGAGPPQPAKYQELKLKLGALWRENEGIENALMQMGSDDVKEKVQALVTGTNGLRQVSGKMIEIMDAMVENGPAGGTGTPRYDPKLFSDQSAQLADLLTEVTTERYPEAVKALMTESKSLSARLRVIDQSFH